MRDGLHLSGKGAGVFADGLKQGVDSGLGNVGPTLFKLWSKLLCHLHMCLTCHCMRELFI